MLKALLTDIDGTLTGPDRRISTGAIQTIRSLADSGVRIVLASGNTSCFMDALCKMIGTDGTFIAENGGVYRIGFTGSNVVSGDQAIAREALKLLEEHFRQKGMPLQLYNPAYRFSDLAIARTVPSDEVRAVLRDRPVQVIDTGFAIHLQAEGISKGTAFPPLARAIGLEPSEFLAAGDSVNDVEMLRLAGVGITVANAHPDTKAVAQYIAKKAYGEGFIEGVERYRSYFRAR